MAGYMLFREWMVQGHRWVFCRRLVVRTPSLPSCRGWLFKLCSALQSTNKDDSDTLLGNIKHLWRPSVATSHHGHGDVPQTKPSTDQVIHQRRRVKGNSSLEFRIISGIQPMALHWALAMRTIVIACPPAGFRCRPVTSITLRRCGFGPGAQLVRHSVRNLL